MTDPVREALAELVTLKDMKEAAKQIVDSEDCNIVCNTRYEEWRRLVDGYSMRKPLAWAIARAALAQEPADQAVPDVETHGDGAQASVVGGIPSTAPPADDLVRPALERIVSRLDSSGNYSSGASADVKIILAAITERDRRIAALEAEVERLRDANGVDIYIADAEAAERRAAASEAVIAAADAMRMLLGRMTLRIGRDRTDRDQFIADYDAAIAAQDAP